MKVVSYRVFLEQPLLATQLLGDPNSSVSFPYIPGSLLRGMLINRYRERTPGKSEEALAHDPICRRLFFDGTTRYLHAFPLLTSGQRSLPTPHALVRPKGSSTQRVYNAAHADFDWREVADDGVPKPLRELFCLLKDDEISLIEQLTNRITVHVARERGKGRATADGGTIFQYDALAAGQVFGGVILADADDDATTLETLLPGDAWLGRSRSAGYGHVRVELNSTLDTNWREIGGSYPTLPANEPITLSLLSDTILYDSEGNFVSRVNSAILEAYFGFNVGEVSATQSFSATTLTGGFNNRARTPLPQAYSLAAGSVITLRLSEPVTADKVRQLEERGIGARLAEGFGRVVFQWLTADRFTAEGEALYSVRSRAQDLLPASRITAQQMARRLLDVKVEQAVARFVRDEVAPKARKMPANSQLGRVRVLLRRVVREQASLQALLAELSRFKETARRQFENAPITNTNFWEWLHGLLTEPATRDVWEVLQLSPRSWPLIAGERVERSPALDRSVTLKLIEATLTSASRERKRQEDAQ